MPTKFLPVYITDDSCFWLSARPVSSVRHDRILMPRSDLLCQGPTFCEPPSKRFDEPFIALPAFVLGSLAQCVRQRRCGGEPEADQEQRRFIADGDIAFAPLDSAGEPAERPDRGRHRTKTQDHTLTATSVTQPPAPRVVRREKDLQSRDRTDHIPG